MEKTFRAGSGSSHGIFLDRRRLSSACSAFHSITGRFAEDEELKMRLSG
jgi:hypothetical protein